MQIAQDKQPADQGKEAKRSVQGMKKTRTTSGHHGRGGPSSPGCGDFSCDASFCPAINVRLLLVFAFKKRNESGS